MHDLSPIFVVGILVLGVYKLFELFVRKSERLAIIEKLFFLSENKEISGSINFPDISFGNANNGSWALRIALLLMGVGLGCLLAFFIQYGLFGNNRFDDWQTRQLISVSYFSSIAIFGGAGLLTAYLIELKQAKNK
ncbi:hypothetical protein FACS189432_00380 [Bacteroidia bacterium]|nr:hypothetical protein FACS189426_01920 [Bacteroidia bacterium]GHT26279.1 hypothetical protein FACS189432_00380 [Bacteroidia bacterium]